MECVERDVRGAGHGYEATDQRVGPSNPRILALGGAVRGRPHDKPLDAQSMSLMDRDWYRAELAQRQRRLRRDERRRALTIAVVATAMVLTALAILPVAVAPRCDFAAWQRQPVACWRWSWAALSVRVAGNMEATRGFPIATVRVDRRAIQARTSPTYHNASAH
jgi:hypothetical protein